MLRANKPKIPSQNGDEVENEESISDADLENIVGIGDSSELEVLDADLVHIWSLLLHVPENSPRMYFISGNGSPKYPSV